ncbi:hypothetical protein [Virgisporangium aurantiacum]|uniref:Uncharacterized protein n=1 Tax=Virgisporangium aurantiacum TaxID=175570 RepID=A0A8J3ZGL2_9ACTN|nr:hypothetical protein [Virgisporangium aurantiacum]GIJ63769.1 hypothetical protein Vau01_112850 [Virgisporangium aurantiacum]
MNTIEFRAVLLPVAWEPSRWPVVDIAVDGVSLIQRVRELELPYAEAEEIERASEFADLPPGTLAQELAGNYMPLSTNFAWPSRHFLGERLELPHGGDEGETMVLGCTCGINDCWALLTRVVLTEQTVTWSGFRNNSRNWDLSGLGPLVFNRSQYEDSLRSSGNDMAA